MRPLEPARTSTPTSDVLFGARRTPGTSFNSYLSTTTIVPELTTTNAVIRQIRPTAMCGCVLFGLQIVVRVGVDDWRGWVSTGE